MPADELVAALYRLRDPKAYGISGRKTDIHDRIILLVGHLLRHHRHPPTPFIYECMVDAMAAPKGSAPGVAALLKEMAKQDILPDASTCQKALAALAIHPDYVLRQTVLNIMRERWFTIDQTSQQYVALGLLRDGQYELAYDKLSAMRQDNVPTDVWVLDIFIMLFGRLGFLDEMLQIFIDRKQAEGGDVAYLGLAYYVLDVCSSAYHYQGTSLAWTLTVRNDALKPSDGMLENVLATAAREGDFDLASQVLSMLSDRGRVHERHYDALVEAFAAGSNLDGAIRMARIMARNSGYIGRSHTRPIYSLLLREQHLLAGASSIIRIVAEEGHVPLAAVGAVIEASAQVQGSKAALDLYQDVEVLTGRSDHHTGTIEAMILYCKEKDLMSRLVTDYRQKVDVGRPPAPRQSWAAHELVIIFLDMDEFQLAMHTAKGYIQEHAGRKELIPWLTPLTQRAIDIKDARIWELMNMLQGAGHLDAVETLSRAARQRRTMTAMELPASIADQ